MASILALALALPAAAQSNDDILGAASRGLAAYLERVPAGQEAAFGFSNRGEFPSATLAAPYRVCTIAPRVLRESPAPETGQIEILDIYRVPVMVDGRMRALLTVVRGDDGWQAVDFGAAGLAAALDRIEREGPLLPDADRRLILRQYQLAMDFVVRLRSGEAAETGSFVPLPSALQALGSQPEAFVLYSYPELFGVLKDRIAGTPLPEAGPAPGAAAAAERAVQFPGPPVETTTAVRVLPITYCHQEQTNWCWDASSQCIFKYYGTVLAQCTIAEWARTHATSYNFGSVNCCTDPSKGCNHVNYLWGGGSGMREILSNWGISSSVYSRQMYFSELSGQVDLYRPFVINWMWKSGGGHVLVGYGYSGTQVYYMDPWEGLKIAEYNWVVDSVDHNWGYALQINNTFIPTLYTLTVSCNAGGTTEPAAGSYSIQKDAVVTLKATPQPYYQFVNWTGSVTGSTNPLDVTMTGNCTINAVFAIIWAPVNLTGTKQLVRGLAQGQYVSALRWESNPGNVNVGSHKVYRNDGSGWTLIAELASGATSYWDRGVAKSSAFTYRVVVVSATGYAGYPAEIYVK